MSYRSNLLASKMYSPKTLRNLPGDCTFVRRHQLTKAPEIKRVFILVSPITARSISPAVSQAPIAFRLGVHRPVGHSPPQSARRSCSLAGSPASTRPPGMFAGSPPYGCPRVATTGFPYSPGPGIPAVCRRKTGWCFGMPLNPQREIAGRPFCGEGRTARIHLPYPERVIAPTRAASQHQQKNHPHKQIMPQGKVKKKTEGVVEGCYTFCITLKISDIL